MRKVVVLKSTTGENYFPINVRNISILSSILIFGAGLIWILTRHGIGMSPDSVVYVGAAESLVAGQGFSVPFGENLGQPLVHYPPLYPLTLALFGVADFGVRQGARVLNAILLVGSAYLVFMMLSRLVRSFRAAILTTVVFILSPLTVMIHSMAWSEPLFLFMMLAGMLTLGGAIASRHWPGMFLSAALLGFVSLTRYAGLALVVAGALTVSTAPGFRWKERLAGSAAYIAIGSIPLFVWLLHNFSVEGTLTGREIAVHPLTAGHLWQAVETVTGWFFLPELLPGTLKLIALFSLAIATAVYLWNTSLRTPETSGSDEIYRLTMAHNHIRIFVIFALVYIIFLVISISFVDANTSLDDRILSPVFIIVFLLVSFALIDLWGHIKHKSVGRHFVSLLVFVIAAFSLQRTAQWSIRGLQEGIGFNHRNWRESELLDRVRMLGEGSMIYTNSPEAVYLQANMASYPLPRAVNKVTAEKNQDLTDQIELMSERLRENKGYLVFFSAIQSDAWLSPEELVGFANLELVSVYPEGSLYTSAYRRQPGK